MKITRVLSESGHARRVRDLSTLAESQQPSRNPIVYANNDYLLSHEAAWTGVQVPPKPWGFLDSDAVQQYLHAATSVFHRLFPSARENAGHLIYTNRVHSAQQWQQGVVANFSAENGWDPSPYFTPFVEASRQAVDRQEFFVPSTYIFTRVGLRGDYDGWRGVLRRTLDFFLSGMGIDNNNPNDEERAFWPEQADNVREVLYGSWLQAQPIGRRELEWLVRHLDTPGLPTPELAPADDQEWQAGKWRTTLASDCRVVDLGKVEKTRLRCVEFDAPTGDGMAYAAYLPINHVPARIAGHTMHWLNHLTTLPFPVDASVYFEVIDPERAEKEVSRPINRAQAQAEEKQEAGFEPDDTTQAQEQMLRQVQARVRMGREPLVNWQAVLRVYDTDKDQLKKKVNQLIQHYRDIQFELVCPTKDQRELHYQFMPGSELVVADWLQKTDPKYFAAAMPWLTSSVGDRTENGVYGLYQGHTISPDTTGTARQGVPVFYDLFNVVDEEDKAPTEVVSGESGSGKTVSRGLKVCHEDGLRGVTQFIWDPKGDFLPLKKWARQLKLNDEKVHVVDLGDVNSSVSLDAFAIAEVDRNNDIDERQTLAIEVLSQLCEEKIQPGTPAGQLLTQAVKLVLEREYSTGETATMAGVLELISSWSMSRGLEASDIVESYRDAWVMTAKELSDHLNTIRSSTLGRLLFRDPRHTGSMQFEQGSTTIFVAKNMHTTQPGEARTPTSRISDVISALMTDQIRSLVLTLPDWTPKSVVFDEWHVIRQSRRAEAFADWQRRMGRSKRCVIRQMSQDPQDFEVGSLSTVWCGYVESREKAEHSCKLLGIEATEDNVRMILNLGKGEFMFRDVHHRVARVNVHVWEQWMFERFQTQALAKAELLSKGAAESGSSFQGQPGASV